MKFANLLCINNLNKHFEECVNVNVSITTKEWAHEISWSLGACESDEGYNDYETYVKTCCLDVGRTYILQCMDSFGDAWNGAYIQIDSTRYCEDFIIPDEYTDDMYKQTETTSFLGNPTTIQLTYIINMFN